MFSVKLYLYMKRLINVLFCLKKSVGENDEKTGYFRRNSLCFCFTMRLEPEFFTEKIARDIATKKPLDI